MSWVMLDRTHFRHSARALSESGSPGFDEPLEGQVFRMESSTDSNAASSRCCSE